MHRQRATSLVAFTGAGVVVVIATFLPWLRSGSTSRSSYDLLGLLSRLDIAPDGVVSDLVRWWPLVPLMITAAVVLAWWRAAGLALAAAVVAVAYAGGMGGTIALASRRAGIAVGIGPWVCAVASVAFLATAVWVVITHASGRDARTPPAALPVDRS